MGHAESRGSLDIYFDDVRNIEKMVAKLEQHAEQLNALGHPSRLSILRYVVQGGPEGTPAGEIQTKLDIPASTLSHHLDKLASAGLLRSRREGTFIYYAPEFEALKALTNYLWEDCCKRGKGEKCC
jgi:ArsR family transcriptional regulator, arsenate/arsenite/antimonite-responsive transcriptional repressor